MSYKFVSGLICIVVCVLISIMLSNKYVEAYKFYSDFCNFNKKLKQSIIYDKTSLVKFLDEQNNDSFFIISLKNIRLEKASYIKNSNLTKDENEYFYNYCKRLGKNDINEEIKNLDKTEKEITEKRKESLEKLNKMRPIYIKFGILIGLILFIVII